MAFSSQAGLASIRTDSRTGVQPTITEPPALADDAIRSVPINKPIPRNAFYAQMSAGHLRRTGHLLTGYLVTNCDGITSVTRTCCG